MARIPMVREDDPTTPLEAREFLKRVEGGLGDVFNAVRLLAYQLQQANALIDFVRSVRYHNSLTPILTELAYPAASVTNRCHYQGLAKHFSVQHMIEICLNVGLAQITNRFNATFLSDVDDYILKANETAERPALA